jgi:hypothetical protein
MVIYTQSETPCEATDPEPQSQSDCSARTVSGENKECNFVEGSPKSCVESEKATPPAASSKKSSSSSTKKSASTSTNSSDILNIFKITLALLIVLTIL